MSSAVDVTYYAITWHGRFRLLGCATNTAALDEAEKHYGSSLIRVKKQTTQIIKRKKVRTHE